MNVAAAFTAAAMAAGTPRCYRQFAKPGLQHLGALAIADGPNPLPAHRMTNSDKARSIRTRRAVRTRVGAD